MDSNPTVPLAFDLAWTSILRSAQPRRGTKFWWCLLVVLMPVSGALIWFLARSLSTPQRPGIAQRAS